MRSIIVVGLLSGLAGSAAGQTVHPDSFPGARAFTFTAGLGNATGWLGLQGERYFGAHSRISALGALGYTPEVDDGDASGVTVALGVRGYTPGLKHRGFLELSVSQLAIERFCFADCHRYYGPGLQAGYQFVSRGGFTLLVSAGLGYAPGVPEGLSAVEGMFGLGLGYTWRR